MPPNPSFGRLCANAIFIARETAHQSNAKFGLSDVARIIDQLDDGRLLTEPEKVSKKISALDQKQLFDALCMACGINPLEATRAIKASVAVALADIRSVSPNLTPEEIRSRADLFKRKHRDWTLTAPALAKYWGELGPATGMTFAAKQELEPTGWKEALRKIYEDDTRTADYLISLGWNRLGKDIRAAINKRLAQPS